MWGEGEGVVCVGSVVCRGNVVWVEWGVGGNVVCVSGRVVGVSGVCGPLGRESIARRFIIRIPW